MLTRRAHGEDYIYFTVDRDVDVYIAYDPSATVLPDWLLNFTDTGQTLAVTDPTSPSLKIYHKSFNFGVNLP